MALFVVACGLLLMLGGAISLLLGFDIVMTERGAAMTIGGVVALSGGVIGVGIGLALVRLNQILRALEARAVKPARAGVPDRPVVPLATDEPRPPAVAPEPLAPEAAAPLSTFRPPPVPAGGSLMPTVAAAGLAAGAAALGAASVLGRSRAEETGSTAPDIASMEAPRPPSTLPDEEGPLLDTPAQASSVEGSQVVEEAGEPNPKPITLPRDLEEELSRALAETDVPLEPVMPPAIVAHSEPDRSFEDGLSKLLGRSGRAPAIASEAVQPQDLADLLEPRAAMASEAESGSDDDTSPAIEPVSAEALSGDMAASGVVAQPSEETVPPPPQAVEALHDESSSQIDALEAALSQPAAGRDSDDDLFNDAPPPRAGEGQGWGETDMEDKGEVQSPAMPPQSTVLGTYTIGGRTYRMFGDGSVEAVSEAGEIERFSSMDELRKHLARA